MARRGEHGSSLPAIRMAVLISRKAASVDTATLLARVAILSLSAVACLAVVAQALLLPSYERLSRVELTPTPPFGEAGGAPTPPPMPPILTEQEAQDAFIESVKKKLAIRTPLDTTFWRPYARVHPEIKASDTNQTNLVFVAGAEGTGHHFITAVMMRLKELMPMTLVQEQMFQALWWKPEERDPAVFWSALESFEE